MKGFKWNDKGSVITVRWKDSWLEPKQFTSADAQYALYEYNKANKLIANDDSE